MIELGSLSVKTPEAFVEARRKIVRLTAALDYNEIRASRLSSIFSELLRLGCTSQAGVRIAVSIDERNGEKGLSFVFSYSEKVSPAPGPALFFDSFATLSREDAPTTISAFSRASNQDFDLSTELVASIRQMLATPSRSELLKDLQEKNEDLRQSAEEIRAAKIAAEKAGASLEKRVVELAGARFSMMNMMEDMREKNEELIATEKKIRAAREEMLAMSQAVEDALIVLDGQGKVRFWNHAAERLFGFDMEEAVGMDFHEMAVPPEARDRAGKGLEEFATTGRGSLFGKRIEVSARNREGNTFPVEVSLSSFRVDNDWFAVGTVRDISERKKVEGELKEYVKDLERFNRLVIGRETRMMQLKEEINALRARLGQSAKYIVPPEADGGDRLEPARKAGEKSRSGLTAIGNITKGRPTLGSTMDVALYRLARLSLRDVLFSKLGPEACDAIFFEAGEQAGRELYRAMVAKDKSLTDFLKEVQELVASLNMGILRIEKSDLKNRTFTLTIAEDLDCSGLPASNEKRCSYDKGFLSGLLLEHTGVRFSVKEVNCWCSGDKICRYEVEPATIT